MDMIVRQSPGSAEGVPGRNRTSLDVGSVVDRDGSFSASSALELDDADAGFASRENPDDFTASRTQILEICDLGATYEGLRAIDSKVEDRLLASIAHDRGLTGVMTGVRSFTCTLSLGSSAPLQQTAPGAAAEFPRQPDARSTRAGYLPAPNRGTPAGRHRTDVDTGARSTRALTQQFGGHPARL